MLSNATKDEIKAAALSKGKEAVLEFISMLLEEYLEEKRPMKFMGDKS